jgi:hypothetical protein
MTVRTALGADRGGATPTRLPVRRIFTGHGHQQFNCVLDDPAGDPHRHSVLPRTKSTTRIPQISEFRHRITILP